MLVIYDSSQQHVNFVRISWSWTSRMGTDRPRQPMAAIGLLADEPRQRL